MFLHFVDKDGKPLENFVIYRNGFQTLGAANIKQRENILINFEDDLHSEFINKEDFYERRDGRLFFVWRDPYERIVSLYKSFVTAPRWNEELRRKLGLSFVKMGSVDYFCKTILKNITCSEYTNTYTNLLKQADLTFDDVDEIVNINDLNNFINDKLGVDVGEVGLRNKSDENISIKGFSKYRSRIYELYKEDYENYREWREKRDAYSKKTCILFVAHSFDGGTMHIFRDIKKQIDRYKNLKIVFCTPFFNRTNDALDEVGCEVFFYDNKDVISKYSNVLFNPSFVMEKYYYEKDNTYDFYWLYEYDVMYTGDFAQFIDYTNDNCKSDLLGSYIRNYEENPEWHHWFFNPNMEKYKFDSHIMACLSIYRLSNAALKCYMEYERDDFKATLYEYAMPTILYENGFTLQDLSGDYDENAKWVNRRDYDFLDSKHFSMDYSNDYYSLLKKHDCRFYTRIKSANKVPDKDEYNLSDYFEKVVVLHCVNKDYDRDEYVYELENYHFYDYKVYETCDASELNNVIIFNNKLIRKSLQTDYYDKRDKNIYARVFDCAYNHYKIIKTAYDQGCESVLIFEDDVNFNVTPVRMKEYILNMPQDYDIIRFSYAIQTDTMAEKMLHDRWVETKKSINKLFYPLPDILQAYYIGMTALSRKGMEYILEYYKKHYIIPADIPYKEVKDADDVKVYYANINLCDGRGYSILETRHRHSY